MLVLARSHSRDKSLCSTMSPSWVTKTMLRASLLSTIHCVCDVKTAGNASE